MTNTPSPTDEDRELIDSGDLKFWNDLVGMMLEYEDSDETAGDFARRIISIFRREKVDRLESLLSDRTKLEEALRDLLGSCSGAPVGGGDGQTRYVTGPSPDALRKARAALNRSTDR